MGKSVDITVLDKIQLLDRSGAVLSNHVFVEEAIEGAINRGAGEYTIHYPERSVKVYGTIAPDTADTVAPTVPASLTLVSKGATSATLSWAASTDAYGVTGYQIFRNGSAIDTTANTSYTSSGLSPSTQYTFTVAAYDAAGNNSGTSGQTPLVVTTDANASPVWSVGEQALTTNQAYSLSLASVCSDADSGTLTFSVVSGTLPTGVTFNAGAGTVSGTPTAVGSSSVTFRATDGIVNVDQAIAFNVLNADATAPSVPANLAVAVASSPQLDLSWDASSDTAGTNERATGVASYRVYRSTDGSNYSLRTTVTAPTVTYSDTGLSASTLYYYKVDAVDGAGNASAQSAAQSATTSSDNNVVVPSVYPLELVSPRASGSLPSAESGTPAMPVGHRIFKAYPGIEYNIRAVVIGGAYPFTFSLSNAPSGMTINAATGEISWPNPATSATPTITVTDAEGTQVSSSWAITVTTTGFRFVSPSGNDTTGDGTLANPWRTLSKVHSSSAIGEIVYFRAGTYTPAGIARSSIGSAWERVEFGSTRATQWLAYPGEQAVFDLGYAAGVDPGATIRATGTTTYPAYFDGVHFTNVRNMLLQPGSGVHYLFIRRCEFSYIRSGTDGDNPSAVMYLSNVGSSPSYYGCMQACSIHDLVSAGAFKTYSQYKWLADGLTTYNSSYGSDIKAYTGRWEVRGCTFDRLTAQYSGLLGNMNLDPAAGLANNGEVRYNLFIGADATRIILDCNQDSNSDEISIYRNTFVTGIVRVRSLLSSGTYNDGPFRFYGNVIVNESATVADRITKLGYSDPPSLDTAPNVILGVANGAGRLNNLAGGSASGIVNSAGLLQGAYRSTYLGTHGHEVP